MALVYQMTNFWLHLWPLHGYLLNISHALLLFTYNVSLREYITDVFLCLSSSLSLSLSLSSCCSFALHFMLACDNVSLNFLFTYTRRIYHKYKKWIQRYDRLQLPLFSSSPLLSSLSSSHMIHTWLSMRRRGYMCKYTTYTYQNHAQNVRFIPIAICICGEHFTLWTQSAVFERWDTPSIKKYPYATETFVVIYVSDKIKHTNLQQILMQRPPNGSIVR